MKLLCTLCLLLAVLSIVSALGKKKDSPTSPGKSRTNIVVKKKIPVKKEIKIEESKKEESVNDDEDDDDDEDSEDDEDGDDDDDEDSDEDKSLNEGSDDEEHENLTFLKSEEFEGNTREQIKEKGIFYSVNSIIENFKRVDYKGMTEVTDFIDRFNMSEAQAQDKMAANVGKTIMPFYVVEGVNPDTRRKVAQILAHRVKGLYVVNQPRVLLGPLLKYDWARQAYYSLSKYMIANKVKMSLHYKPVVTERYWMDHASFIMAKMWEKAVNLPKPGSEVYKHPEDLFVPNITFVIFNSSPPRLGKKASKSYLFEQRQLLVYKRFTGAKIHVIRSPQSAKQIADNIDLFLHGLSPRPAHRRYADISVDYESIFGNKTQH